MKKATRRAHAGGNRFSFAGPEGVAPACTNAFGAVTLADGTSNGVTLGDAGALAFDSLAIGAVATLNITAPSKAEALRVGTAKTLTKAQLLAIRINGGKVFQDGLGYLREKPPFGTVLTLR